MDAPAALFAGLVDDAGLFPPEELPMAAALQRHEADAAVGEAVLSGRFVCPAARLPELQDSLGPDAMIRLALIVSPFDDRAIGTALEHVAGDERLELAALEGPLTDGSAAPSAVPSGVPAFAEVPVTGEWRAHLEAAADASGRMGVKIRCGGLDESLFPTSEQLGALVHACAAAGVTFKATAGLHHAVRYQDPATGFQHHGYLNLLVASSRAAGGRPLEEVVEALEVADAVALADEARTMAAHLAAETRRLFVSYGSCSTSEPVADLRALGLLSSD